MADSQNQFPGTASRSRLTRWALTHLAGQPSYDRSRSLAVVVGLVASIGLLDYLSGPRISLVLLYLVPITLSVAWLGWRVAGAIAVMSILVRVAGDLALEPYTHPLVAAWNRLADLSVYFVIVWVLHLLLSLHRELERRVVERTRALKDSNQARQRLELELLDIGSRERNSIGRELHDDLCQHLVGTALAAKVIAQRLATTAPATAQDVQGIVTYVEKGVAKTRAIAHGLLLASIDPDKLGEKLSELAAEGSVAGLPCRYREKGETLVSDAAIAAQLFRIAQEAMRNALQHAQPLHVDIMLVGDANAICLIVEDDGRGLPPPENRGSGMGLRIMSHRAALIGATLSFVPTPGQGTRVICHLPRTRATP